MHRRILRLSSSPTSFSDPALSRSSVETNRRPATLPSSVPVKAPVQVALRDLLSPHPKPHRRDRALVMLVDVGLLDGVVDVGPLVRLRHLERARLVFGRVPRGREVRAGFADKGRELQAAVESCQRSNVGNETRSFRCGAGYVRPAAGPRPRTVRTPRQRRRNDPRRSSGTRRSSARRSPPCSGSRRTDPSCPCPSPDRT